MSQKPSNCLLQTKVIKVIRAERKFNGKEETSEEEVAISMLALINGDTDHDRSAGIKTPVFQPAVEIQEKRVRPTLWQQSGSSTPRAVNFQKLPASICSSNCSRNPADCSAPTTTSTE